MTSFIRPTIILLLAFAALAQQTDIPVFRAGVALVKIDAQVIDRTGRAIEGLTAADFQVLDENQPQKITYFGRESEPLDLVLLLDVSGSMKRSLQEMAGVARTALKQLHENDRVAVMVFALNSRVRQKFTEDFGALEKQLREAVNDKDLGSGTAINNAIISSALYLRDEPPKGRRAVLIVTDNLMLNYKVPDEEVIRELYASDAVLNAIVIGKLERPEPPKAGQSVNLDFTPPDVWKLAEETGGEAIEGRKPGESFQRMIERIRARYNIQYPAPQAQTGNFRRVRVELAPEARKRHPSAIVRARSGYYPREK